MTLDPTAMTPIPGEVTGIRRHATAYTRTATAIDDAIEMLRAVADEARENTSKAVSTLADTVGETRDRLGRVRGRYEVAGSALTTFSDALEQAQQQAATAIGDYHDADRRHSYAQRNLAEAHAETRQTVDPTELADATASARRYSSMSDVAAADRASAQQAYAAAVGAVEEAGQTAATTIAATVDNDGLGDSWWDDVLDWVNENAEWLSIVKDVLSVLTMIVGALSIFFPVLAPIALGLAAATAGLSFLLAASGSGSWLDFALDMVGVLSFGVGSAAIGAIKVGSLALRGTRGIRLAVTSPRAVYGSTLREMRSNLIERGLVDSVRRPFDLVRREADAIMGARPTLGQVLTRSDTARMAEISEKGSVIIADFTRVAQQARLGSGGWIDDAIIGAAGAAEQVLSVSSKVGTSLDAYNAVSIGMNRVVEWAATTAGDTTMGEVLGGVVDVWNFPHTLTTHPVTEWSVTLR